jgi:hypothetical protein
MLNRIRGVERSHRARTEGRKDKRLMTTQISRLIRQRLRAEIIPTRIRTLVPGTSVYPGA